MEKGESKLKFLHFGILLVLIVFTFASSSAASQKDGLLKIYFLNVGQGDAVFIESPNGNQVLIDGGPDNSVLSELGKVMPFYDHDIDVVVASHPHSDHISGLISVLDRYKVDTIIEAKEEYDSPQFKAWQNAVQNEKAKEIEAIAGTIINLGNEVILTLIHPFESVAGTATAKPHNDVVAAMLEYRSFRLLLTGDMEKKVEENLVEAGIDIEADVLKVGHHGSKTSSTDIFLEAVQPQIGVIQVGAKNPYNHPSPDVIRQLESRGIKYYRTDADGTIKLFSNGIQYQILRSNLYEKK